jgi:hypothetical protein
MHLLIYIILFIILLIYIDKNKIKKLEKLNNTEQIKKFSDNSILTNNNNNIIGQDLDQDNIYNNKFWNINSNLSNMFEQEENNNKEENNKEENNKEENNKEENNKEENNKEENKKNNKVLKNINIDSNNYQLLGKATNTYYNQKYFIYENKIKEDPRMGPNNLYQYVLINDENQIMYKFSPRTKLNINDNTYLSQGVLQVGPFRISAYNL